jgi:hypothetical protein
VGVCFYFLWLALGETGSLLFDFVFVLFVLARSHLCLMALRELFKVEGLSSVDRARKVGQSGVNGCSAFYIVSEILIVAHCAVSGFSIFIFVFKDPKITVEACFEIRLVYHF